jgi:hypothetical protein
MIDWTINLGHILTIIVLVTGGAGVFYALRTDVVVIKNDMSALKSRQDALGEAFTQLGNILTKVAVQDERLNQMSKTIDEMRHGQGFVNPMRS